MAGLTIHLPPPSAHVGAVGGRHATFRLLPFVAVLLASVGLPREGLAQNDWQFPDPYFGILEIEKSHDAAARRRYRAEVSPPSRREAHAASEHGMFGTAPADHAAAPRSNRFRWRTRSRR